MLGCIFFIIITRMWKIAFNRCPFLTYCTFQELHQLILDSFNTVTPSQRPSWTTSPPRFCLSPNIECPLCVGGGGDLRTPRAVSTQQKWALRRGRCCSCRGTSGWSHCSRDPSGTGEQRFGAEPGWAALLHTHEWMYEPTHSHIHKDDPQSRLIQGKHIAP